jgi:hypothetical protein
MTNMVDFIPKMKTVHKGLVKVFQDRFHNYVCTIYDLFSQ